MKNSTAISIALLIIVGAGYFVIEGKNNEQQSVSVINKTILSDEQKSEEGDVAAGSEENSIIKDGVQYVTITSHGGYTPKQSNAKAGIPTKLVIKTSNTYDCSASLVIHSLNYRKVLPNTGETIIDMGIPKKGEKLQGVCAMGMYSFVITFK